MDSKVTPEETNCSLGSGPFVFSGRPPYIQGVVNLINRSAEKIKVRSIVIEGAGIEPYRTGLLPQPEKQKLAERARDSLQVKLAGRVDPYDNVNVYAQLTVAKFTPPGEYKAQVRFGQQQVPALIFVLENDNLRLTPDEIKIVAAPGERVTRSIYITNEGNVPFSTRKAAFAPLQALDMLHESLAIALNEAGHAGHAKFLDRFVERLADNEVQPAKVKIDLKEENIAPGETKCVEITIQLPADIKRKRTYTSTISFGNETLSVEVEVNGRDKKTNGRTR
ncbi:MAG TPA: hypothetical protein VN956_23715 [Pyrinomonadaceae bacterium]|nr:hypothetical protein [Pyrinomonadaceae bacterium]